MSKKRFALRLSVSVLSLLHVGCAADVEDVERAALASHAWGKYHWARTSNPFTIKLGDNVSSAWAEHLSVAAGDWSRSSVLDATVAAGGGGRRCRSTSGRSATRDMAPTGGSDWPRSGPTGSTSPRAR
ncbi:hypothetical protein WME73_27195 [Sorangium sp. So ce302]|uniref:hypothetical protein n=1 Tax=Sorangium sp. So ce302 TaxID=3133297 RepID=UPI003F5F8A9D